MRDLQILILWYYLIAFPYISHFVPDGKFFFIMGKNPEKLVALPSQRNFICLAAKILLAASQISHPF